MAILSYFRHGGRVSINFVSIEDADSIAQVLLGCPGVMDICIRDGKGLRKIPHRGRYLVKYKEQGVWKEEPCAHIIEAAMFGEQFDDYIVIDVFNGREHLPEHLQGLI